MASNIVRTVSGSDVFSRANAARNTLFPLERDELEAIIRNELGDESAYLRQIDQLTVTEREFTGAGFFTEFQSSDESSDEVISTWVHLEVPALQHGAGFVVFAGRGVLTMLEGFSYGEPWPEAIDRYELLWSSGPAESR